MDPYAPSSTTPEIPLADPHHPQDDDSNRELLSFDLNGRCLQSILQRQDGGAFLNHWDP